MDRRGSVHCRGVGGRLWYRARAQHPDCVQQRDAARGDTHGAAAHAGVADRPARSHTGTGTGHADAELAGCAIKTKASPSCQLKRPRLAAGAVLRQSEISRAMSSGARVTVTPPVWLRRTTLTVPAYSGEPE